MFACVCVCEFMCPTNARSTKDHSTNETILSYSICNLKVRPIKALPGYSSTYFYNCLTKVIVNHIERWD